MGVVALNSPAGTRTTVAVHCSEALGVTVWLPLAWLDAAIQYQTEMR
jgi:hypothetical protein